MSLKLVLELGFILALILLNGLLARAEIAVVSARKARLQQKVDEGDRRARAALELAEDPTEFLSTVQIGITLVGMLAGAFSGATLAREIAVGISQVPFLAPYGHAIGISVVVIVISYFTLVLGELVPKRLGLNHAEQVAMAAARPMHRLSRLFSPLVRLLGASSDLVLRLLGDRPVTGPPVTEEEIKVLIEQGTQAGVFAEVEQDMVAGVFRLGDRRVGTLITPRTEIIWLDLDDPLEMNQQKIVQSVHARFPVARGGLDNVLGIVQAKDLLAASLSGQAIDLEALMVEPVMVPENMHALDVLESFRKTHQQLALVFDEYGGLQGLVTISDIVGAVVGDFPQLGEKSELESVQREDGTWLLDGMLPIDEFKDLFRIGSLPGEDRAGYQTLGGFVMACLGRIPRPADHFEWGAYRYEVMDMDGFRVDKVMVSPLPPAADEAAPDPSVK